MGAPRELSQEHHAHVHGCRHCASFSERVRRLDARIFDAALVPVPDALADRVLLPRRHRPGWRQYAAAASVLLALTLGLAGPRVWETMGVSTPIEAVGPTHPAVTAISMVVEQQPAYIDEAREIDFAAMEDGLRRLGLSLKTDEVKIDYAGKCYMPETDCDHLVLETADGQVSVILVPDYPVGSQALVVDRRMTALVSPAGTGGYIVVAGSPKAAKRAGKLFVKG